MPIKYFDIDKSKLSKSEHKVLDYLIKAGEEIHKIWHKQIDTETGDLLLYPEDATEKEILKEAEKNKSLLSPYTVVKREGNKLVTVPYSEEYSQELEKFYEYLKQASDVSDDKILKSYIKNIILLYKKNCFDDAVIVFLKNMSKIEFLCGPLETYEDAFLGRKKTFQFNLRVLKEETTDNFKKMAELIKNVRLVDSSTNSNRKIDPSKIVVRADDLVMFAGRQSKLLVSSQNLPNEQDLVDKYGTKVVIYTTSMEEKFNMLHKPLIPYIKGDNLGDSVDELKSAMCNLVALHEISEGTVKFEKMSERLGKHRDYIVELNADLVGVDTAKYYVLNGLLTLDQYRYLLTAFLVFAIDMCNQFVKTGELNDYVVGNAVLFNRFFETGSLEMVKGKLNIDFTKLAKDVELLSSLIVRILESGTQEDAEKLLKKYGDRSVFEKLPRP